MQIARWFILILLFAPTSYSNNSLPVDVSSFTLSGVALGMTADEAVAAVTVKLGLNLAAVKFEAHPGPNAITPKRHPARFKVRAGQLQLTVYFQPAVPYNPVAPMIVSQVRYRLSAQSSNRKITREAALKKYGQPSVVNANGAYQWCSKPALSSTHKECMEQAQPYLYYLGTGLTLHDPSYQMKVVEYVKQQLTQQVDQL